MSTSRADIAAALAQVAAVTAYPHRPDNVQPGSAWPEWVTSRPQTMGCEVAEITWNVWVTLPTGTTTVTIEAGDAVARQIGAVLNMIGAVVAYSPTQLVGDDRTPIPALRYEFRTD